MYNTQSRLSKLILRDIFDFLDTCICVFHWLVTIVDQSMCMANEIFVDTKTPEMEFEKSYITNSDL